MANRSQPHFWSQSRVAISPDGKIPPGPNHHLLRADRALVSLSQVVVWGDGGGSWLVLGSLFRPLPWHVDMMCQAHLACLAHQKHCLPLMVFGLSLLASAGGTFIHFASSFCFFFFLEPSLSLPFLPPSCCLGFFFSFHSFWIWVSKARIFSSSGEGAFHVLA